MSTSAASKRPPGGLYALLGYVRDPAAYTSDEVRSYTDDVVVVVDKFPKAAVHLLVLPRFTCGAARLPEDKRKAPTGLDSVEDLRPAENEADVAVVETLVEACSKLVHELEREHPILTFRVGVHAIPSMHHLHVHVVSQDFVSDGMKTKHHWKSFTTRFFVPLAWVAEQIVEKRERIQFDKPSMTALAKRALVCHECCERSPNGGTSKPMAFTSMPALKRHLAEKPHGIRRSSRPTSSAQSQ
ncbi:aprataxin-like protein [Blastocladiella emersonii ATCC 22665]|nr:aprataxin-like protein [Blastocladiella emersonii ATCC 22665]